MEKKLILKQQEILREDLFEGIISFQQFEQADLALRKSLSVVPLTTVKKSDCCLVFFSLPPATKVVDVFFEKPLRDGEAFLYPSIVGSI